MGGGVGNFSYAALNASLSSRSGKPFRRDTSIVYAGPGASYTNQTIPTGAPGGWRLFRIEVTDPYVFFKARTDSQWVMGHALPYHSPSSHGYAGELYVCGKPVLAVFTRLISG